MAYLLTINQKTMKKKLLAIIMILAAIGLTMGTMMSCKKNNPQPTVAKTTQTAQQQNLDTSLSGKYKMISCDIPTELDTALMLTLVYKASFPWSPADTTDKVILYTIPNNVNSAPGNVRISATVIYQNEGINHSQPYIQEHRDTISTGFIESSNVSLNGANRFHGDTLLLNYHVSPLTGPHYDMHVKYLKR